MTTTKVITGVVRLSFPHLFEKYAVEGKGEPKYSCMLLIPKTDKTTIRKIKAAQVEALKLGASKFKGGKPPKNWKDTLRDGDEEKDTEEYPEYEGHYFMNVSGNRRPGVVDINRNPVEPEEIYSGCYVRASINAYAFNTQGNAGVSFGLNNVQKVRDGEPLGGGGSKAEDDFDDDFEDDPAEDDLV